MAKYYVNDSWHTINELSEMSGIASHTIRDRLRRGYTINEAIKVTATKDSVKAFSEASWWEDWLGMSINDLFKIYVEWCIRNGYTPLHKQGFSRQLITMYPMLKTIPTRIGDNYCRVIRLRG